MFGLPKSHKNRLFFVAGCQAIREMSIRISQSNLTISHPAKILLELTHRQTYPSQNQYTHLLKSPTATQMIEWFLQNGK